MAWPLPRCARAPTHAYALRLTPRGVLPPPGRARADRRGILQRNDDPTREVPDVARREESFTIEEHTRVRKAIGANVEDVMTTDVVTIVAIEHRADVYR